jgi:hypothetical protein
MLRPPNERTLNMYSYDHTSHISDMTALLGRFDEFPPGCDPDFDADLEELERQFAELRVTFGE